MKVSFGSLLFSRQQVEQPEGVTSKVSPADAERAWGVGFQVRNAHEETPPVSHGSERLLGRPKATKASLGLAWRRWPLCNDFFVGMIACRRVIFGVPASFQTFCPCFREMKLPT